MKVSLLIVDPQNDFCHPNGALFVPGANEDMQRLSKWIQKYHQKLDEIHVTLDSHRLFDVAHPIFWKNDKGENPAPFTLISVDMVKNGEWVPTVQALTKRMIDYVEMLEKNGRYPLCIWPPHCLIGSWGHGIVTELYTALMEWEKIPPAMVNYVAKGSNPYTEHYSAIKADVPDSADDSTQLNTKLIADLMKADMIVIAGEASSHCVANTIRDIANEFGDDSLVKKFVYLEDCCSPVPMFEQFETDFIAEMKSRGMQISNTNNLFF
jgi:nicotinamidase-related amidase